VRFAHLSTPAWTSTVSYLLFFIYFLGWSGTKSTIIEATYWPVVPALDDIDDCGTIGEMNDWKGKLKY
jgi:hypothetical protein